MVYDVAPVAVLKKKKVTENILIQDGDEEEKGRKIKTRRQKENIRGTG
jgi:hypothetical protein